MTLVVISDTYVHSVVLITSAYKDIIIIAALNSYFPHEMFCDFLSIFRNNHHAMRTCLFNYEM